MSKNLRKASDWIQRDIDDLQENLNTYSQQKTVLQARIEETNERIAGLKEVLEQLPRDNGDKINSPAVAEVG